MKLYLVEQTRYLDEGNTESYHVQFFTNTPPIIDDPAIINNSLQDLILIAEFENVPEDLAKHLLTSSDMSLLVARDSTSLNDWNVTIPVEPWEREDRVQMQKVLSTIIKPETVIIDVTTAPN